MHTVWRKQLDWIGEKYNVQSQQDWFKVTLKEVRQMGGSSLLDAHRNSLTKSLSSLYPEFDWSSSFQSIRSHPERRKRRSESRLTMVSSSSSSLLLEDLLAKLNFG